MSLKKIPGAQVLPLSWSLTDWPSNVFPNSSRRARQLINAHRDALIEMGALSRPGREIVVLADPYGRWLAKHSARVAGYDLAPNRPEHAAKRGGRGGER